MKLSRKQEDFIVLLMCAFGLLFLIGIGIFLNYVVPLYLAKWILF